MSDDFRNDNAVERRDEGRNLHLVHLAPTASGLTAASCWIAILVNTGDHIFAL